MGAITLKIPFWLLVSPCAAPIQHRVFLFRQLLFHCKLLTGTLLESLGLVSGLLVDLLAQRCLEVRVPDRVGAADVTTVAPIQKIDFGFFDNRYFSLASFFLQHDLATLVENLLVA